ncbi:hypothetical protein GGR54DRAFT_458589 [Hypoxylon sp. NC1633]|nr:hypothetical protein GGR54DRAFT_458589 [Hypoxylon sp. NC1633]
MLPWRLSRNFKLKSMVFPPCFRNPNDAWEVHSQLNLGMAVVSLVPTVPGRLSISQLGTCSIMGLTRVRKLDTFGPASFRRWKFLRSLEAEIIRPYLGITIRNPPSCAIDRTSTFLTSDTQGGDYLYDEVSFGGVDMDKLNATILAFDNWSASFPNRCTYVPRAGILGLGPCDVLCANLSLLQQVKTQGVLSSMFLAFIWEARHLFKPVPWS